jgi:hypothetical protein
MDAPIYRFDQYDPHHLPNPGQAGLVLEITRGQARQKLRPVRERVFLIGTASDCDLVLGDLSFPETYAYLFIAGERVTIRRLGSGPELYVCGEQVQTAELFRGDVVSFGPFELRLSIEQPPTESQAPAGETSDSSHGPPPLPSIRVFDPSDSPCQA